MKHKRMRANIKSHTGDIRHSFIECVLYDTVQIESFSMRTIEFGLTQSVRASGLLRV